MNCLISFLLFSIFRTGIINKQKNDIKSNISEQSNKIFEDIICLTDTAASMSKYNSKKKPQEK